MITITEATPKKISGSTSLFLDAPYNETLIRFLKSLELAVWHKKEGLWELPVTVLAELLNELAYEDDITVKLLSEDIHDNQLITYPSMSPWLQEFIHKYNNTQ